MKGCPKAAYSHQYHTCSTYLCDITVAENIKIATFTDDIAILIVGNIIEKSTNLESAIDNINM